ncbi:hypothetical protein FRC03_007235 [Tulasnella sp. 419]|nr:hypothetical protein FRC03_007235 [Tulasnella sp. 419]
MDSLPSLQNFNIIGAYTAIQGLITMIISWSILYRAETAQLTANDHKAQVLYKLSYDSEIRLKLIRDRITDIANRNKPHGSATADMLTQLETAILDFTLIRDFCADMQNRMWIDRWYNSKGISIHLQELEARAKDPSHILNLTLTGVFALLEQNNIPTIVDK